MRIQFYQKSVLHTIDPAVDHTSDKSIVFTIEAFPRREKVDEKLKS
jgi:hypothetical protein